VVGLLKMGWKKLYLFNKKGSRTEAMVYCLLDFYIHETRQRHGYGIKLMDYMLKVLKYQKKNFRQSNFILMFFRIIKLKQDNWLLINLQINFYNFYGNILTYPN